MNRIFILFFVLLLTCGIKAQMKQPCSTCLPEGITFTTQAQIDSFQVNYPNCTEIEGNVTICGDSSITNLNGLIILSSIGGNLQFYNNENLTDLTGLSALNYIGGFLYINGNSSLINLDGLDALTISIDGIDIEQNPALTSLSGLNSLEIAKYITIIYNESLTSLTGIENINADSISGLSIYNNISLSTCDVQSICDFLSNPNCTITIYGNDFGCDNAPQIASACGISFTCLPYGDYYFTTQSDIDSFQYYYPSCSDLTGDIYIMGGDSISNLYGLNNVTSIVGDLHIYNNDSLTSLVGLDSLSYISGNLNIWGNDALSSMVGLDNLTTIEGSLSIGDDHFGGNPGLTSLTGLSSLEIARYITIIKNESLLSLTGIDYVDENSIWSVWIENNNSLSTCEVESMCNYAVGYGNMYVNNNATGCSSRDEIVVACGLNVDETTTSESKITIYPNPSTTAITISLPATTPVDNTALSIYNVNMQQVLTLRFTYPTIVVDISTLPGGIYFARLTNDRSVMVSKFIKG